MLLSGRRVCQLGGEQLRFLGDRVDVVGQRQRHDVGLQPVDHRAGLLARSAVRLLDRDRLPGLRLPIPCERGVVVLVQLARRIVGDVEDRQRTGRAGVRKRSEPHARDQNSRNQDPEARSPLYPHQPLPQQVDNVRVTEVFFTRNANSNSSHFKSAFGQRRRGPSWENRAWRNGRRGGQSGHRVTGVPKRRTAAAARARLDLRAASWTSAWGFR